MVPLLGWKVSHVWPTWLLVQVFVFLSNVFCAQFYWVRFHHESNSWALSMWVVWRCLGASVASCAKYLYITHILSTPDNNESVRFVESHCNFWETWRVSSDHCRPNLACLPILSLKICRLNLKHSGESFCAPCVYFFKLYWQLYLEKGDTALNTGTVGPHILNDSKVWKVSQLKVIWAIEWWV